VSKNRTEIQTPKVSIVTPVFNGIEYTAAYLRSMLQVTYPNIEIIIVDDGSTDGTADRLAREFPQVRVLSGDGNLWWSGGTNLGIRDALERGTDFVLTMNNDVKVAPEFLDALMNCARKRPGAIVGGKIFFIDQPDRIWSAGGKVRWASGKTFEILGHGITDCAEFSRSREVDFFTGMCVLYPASLFGRIGYFDAADFPQYHADSEFTLRARAAGIPVVFEPDAKVWNRVDSTFMQRFVKLGRFGANEIRELLTSFRSPMNLKEYWLIHRRYCPKLLLPLAFGLRLARVAMFLLKIKVAFLKGGKALEEIGT
jgi:GT2 family glycosyltransferase